MKLMSKEFCSRKLFLFVTISKYRLKSFIRTLTSRLNSCLKSLGNKGQGPTDPIGNNIIENLAGEVIGADASVLDLACKYLKNDQNSLVCEHSIRAMSAYNSEQYVLRVIEKRTNNVSEYEFYRYLCSNPLDRDFRITPTVYSVVEHEDGGTNQFKFSIVMENLEKIGLKDFSHLSACKLAEALSCIPSLSVEEMPLLRISPNKITSDLVDQFVSLAIWHNQTDSAAQEAELESMRKNAKCIGKIDLSQVPLVPCHNDIHLKNLFFYQEKEKESYVFIDWEQFGLNYLGADVHHFLRRGSAGMRHAAVKYNFVDFVDKLYDEYRSLLCDAYELKHSEFDKSAYYYSLFRCMQRSVERKFAGREGFMLEETIRLYQGLIRVL